MKRSDLVIAIGAKPSMDKMGKMASYGKSDHEKKGDQEKLQMADDAAKEFASKPSCETFLAAMRLCEDYEESIESMSESKDEETNGEE